ncbi:4Fe-4S dicluster domain-containing protein [Thermophagus sp. OGC60D27]|uniref:4Fe-4S dicluster domain-containing protein n=1 Tax=Thermophagus sp. OGC60D27 TaxID=3458415 RepID=UPI0040377762
MLLYKILKRSRVIIALAVLILITSLFVDIYGWIPNMGFDKITYLQFLPSVLHFLAVFSLVSAGGFLVIMLLTLITGRIYCSAICPLGIFQDIVNHFGRRKSKKKRFFKFHKAKPVLRYSFLGITTIAIMVGAGWLVTWLDPYSIIARGFTYLMKPVVIWFNNGIMAPVLQKFEVYSFYHQNLMVASILPAILTLVVISAIGYFAWKRGRLFCNTLCPVGTLLGEISRFSFFKVQFDRDACTRCGKCAGVCKSECIDIKNYTVDTTRCVTCFNCLVTCPESALSLRPAIKGATPNTVASSDDTGRDEVKHDSTRRKLLMTGLAVISGSRIYALKKEKLPDHQKKLARNKKDHPVAPPGSVSIKRFNDICTGCSLCIAACPTGVLQPALTEYGLSGFMQPHMDYSTHFCNYDCNKCGEVCPTGAILPLPLEEKQVTQMGKAVFVQQNCVVYTDGTVCGACSEHCPTKAVTMVPYKDGLRIPHVDQSICIGCGACEYPCPVPAPFKAIYVNGNAVQQKAEQPYDEGKQESIPEDDFPF